MNTGDNYNGQTQQIQMNKNRKGGGKNTCVWRLITEVTSLWKGLNSSKV